MNNRDVTVLYQGASGGFLLFYYLLLGGQYYAGIPELQFVTVDDLIQKQFNQHLLLLNRASWKTQEYWPDNQSLKESSVHPKLFLICNPFFAPDKDLENRYISSNTFKILLYTDLKLQIRMAWDKQAWWFTKVSRQRFNAGTNSNYIRWIHSQGKYDADINKIQTEYTPDLQVRLEEFVNTARLPGFPDPNQKQRDFIKYWLTLQSPKAQYLLYR